MKIKNNKIYILPVDDSYWDCMCEKHYVHSLERGNYCGKCKTHAGTMPSSFTHDIKHNYNPELDHVTKV